MRRSYPDAPFLSRCAGPIRIQQLRRTPGHGHRPDASRIRAYTPRKHPASQHPTRDHRGERANTRIGYEHPDSLITYPDTPFLSGCAGPIQMCRSYPDARVLSGCAGPVQMQQLRRTPGHGHRPDASRIRAHTPRKHPASQHQPKPRRTARGYRNPTNYQLRMLLIAGGLDASTHTQL